jgi:peptide deformylase
MSVVRLKLVQVGEAVLRQMARPLSLEEIRSEYIRQLIRDMHETLRDLPGVGLAAPQVGVSIRLAILEDLPEYSRDLGAEQLASRERRPTPFHVIGNPEIAGHGGGQVEFFEGCLSLGGFTALVPRFRQVSVRCLNEDGEPTVIEASGWYARILQHEIDHLNGAVYVDRMHTRTFMTLENFTRRWKDQSIAEVRRALLSTGKGA